MKFKTSTLFPHNYLVENWDLTIRHNREMFTNAVPLRRELACGPRPRASTGRATGRSNRDLKPVHPTKALADVLLQVLWLRLPCSLCVKRTRARWEGH